MTCPREAPPAWPSERLAADLFGSSEAAPPDLPPDVAAGLKLLASSPPLWPIDPPRWTAVVDSVTAFAGRWDGRARACGWTPLQLYGLHRRAPWANVAGMGAAFLIAADGRPVPVLVALKGGPAIAVDQEAIRTLSPGGARLRIFRRTPDPDSVLAWSLCPPVAIGNRL